MSNSLDYKEKFIRLETLRKEYEKLVSGNNETRILEQEIFNLLQKLGCAKKDDLKKYLEEYCTLKIILEKLWQYQINSIAYEIEEGHPDFLITDFSNKKKVIEVSKAVYDFEKRAVSHLHKNLEHINKFIAAKGLKDPVKLYIIPNYEAFRHYLDKLPSKEDEKEIVTKFYISEIIFALGCDKDFNEFFHSNEFLDHWLSLKDQIGKRLEKIKENLQQQLGEVNLENIEKFIKEEFSIKFNIPLQRLKVGYENDAENYSKFLIKKIIDKKLVLYNNKATSDYIERILLIDTRTHHRLNFLDKNILNSNSNSIDLYIENITEYLNDKYSNHSYFNRIYIINSEELFLIFKEDALWKLNNIIKIRKLLE